MNLEKLFPKAFMIQMPREKREELTPLRPEQLSMVIGSEDLEMALVFNNGLMEPGMKDTGKITEPMERANLLILTEIFTMESG
jgi:hypothetical protein